MMTTRRFKAATLAAAAVLSVLPAGAMAGTSAGGRTDVIVRGPSSAASAAAVAGIGGAVVRQLPIVGGVAARVDAARLGSLRAAGLQVDVDGRAQVSSADFSSATDVQLAALDPPASWDLSAGRGVAVALVDTGVDEVPDLAGRVVRGPDLSGDGDGADHYGHGTFMAGLIAGDGSASAGGGVRHVGVAPGATVVSVKVAGADGATSTSAVIAGIDWVVDHADETGVRVLNLSFAAPALGTFRTDPLSAAVEAAWASGITVVAAAGNDGAGHLASPGWDPWVLTAGATDTNGTATVADDTVAPFSASGHVGPVAKPEVLAPGVGIVSLRAPGSTIDVEHPSARVGDAYFRGSGTSMAAAEASGAAAVVLAAHPDATPDDVKGALATTAARVSGAVGGAVDLAAAVSAPAADWTQWHPIADGAVDDAPMAMPWAATRWSATRWSATRWSATRWSATRWSATRWSAVRWSAVRWSAVRWSAVRWSAVRWSDDSWGSG